MSARSHLNMGKQFFLQEAIFAFGNSNNVVITHACDLNNRKYQIAHKIKIKPNIDYSSDIFIIYHSLRKKLYFYS